MELRGRCVGHGRSDRRPGHEQQQQQQQQKQQGTTRRDESENTHVPLVDDTMNQTAREKKEWVTVAMNRQRRTRNGIAPPVPRLPHDRHNTSRNVKVSE